jgi:membrane protein
MATQNKPRRASNASRGRLRSTWPILRDSVTSFVDDDVMTLAAGLAFYTLLSFAPLIVLAVLASSVAGDGARNALLDEIAAVIGPAARDAAAAVIENGKAHPSAGGIAGVVGTLTAVIGATTVFAQLQSSLNVIFGVVAKPASAVWDWLRRRVISIGVIFAIAFVMIASLMVSATLGVLLPGGGLALDSINQIVSAIVFAGLFALLFRYLPDTRIPWRFALTGGFVTAVLFAIGKWLIGAYLAGGDVGGAYGAAGSVVVLLVWVYYAGAILLYGAELTKTWMTQRGIAVEPLARAALASRKTASA